MLAHFHVELAGAPTGIAHHHVPAFGAITARDCLQHVERGGEGPGIANPDRARCRIVRLVQHETVAGFDRAAFQHRGIGHHAGIDVELGQQRVQPQIRVRPVDHQAQRAAFIVQAHGDCRAIKPVIADAGHRQQQLARKKRRGFHARHHRPALDARQSRKDARWARKHMRWTCEGAKARTAEQFCAPTEKPP